MNKETIKLGNKEVVFTQLPATARTLKLLAPLLSKKKDDGENIKAMVDAIVASLSYEYGESEVDEILDLIPLKEDGQLLEKIAGVLFRGMQQ